MIYRFKAFRDNDLIIDKLLYRPIFDRLFIDKAVILNSLDTDKSINRYGEYLFIGLSLEG